MLVTTFCALSRKANLATNQEEACRLGLIRKQQRKNAGISLFYDALSEPKAQATI